MLLYPVKYNDVNILKTVASIVVWWYTHISVVVLSVKRLPGQSHFCAPDKNNKYHYISETHRSNLTRHSIFN